MKTADEYRAEKVHRLVMAFLDWCERTVIDATDERTIAKLEQWGDYEWGVLAQAAQCRPPDTSRPLVIERLRMLARYKTSARKTARK